MKKKRTTEKSADEQHSCLEASSIPSSAPPPATETQKSDTSSERQASSGQVVEQTTRCEETGETSFCDNRMGSKGTDKVDSGVTENSATPLLSVTSLQHEKSVLNKTGETIFSEDDGEEEVNQPDTESSDDDDLAMRLRRRDGGDSEDEDDDEDEDEDEIEVEGENGDGNEGEDEEEDYYTDDRASQTSSEGEVLDSTRGPDETMSTHEEKEKKKNSDSPVNRRDPTYVPREGAFYLHDARDESGDDDGEVKVTPASETASTRRSGMLAKRWDHDLYIEQQQCPRTTEEIIRRYGYDIRKYGLDPTQEVTSRHVVGGSWKRSQARGRGVRFANSHNDVAAFTTKDFPALEERDNYRNRNRRGGSRFHDPKREENLHQRSKTDGRASTLNVDAGSPEDAPKKGHPITQRGRRGCGFTPHEGQKEVVVVEEFRKRRGSGGRGVSRRFFNAEGDARRGFHNFNTTRNRGRVASTVVVPKSQPSPQQSQPQLPLQAPRSGKRYSVNRKTHRPEPSEEGQRVEFVAPTLPDAEMRQLYRSVDPSIVAALVQRHQMENPEAFEAAKAASLSMVEERTLRVVNREPKSQQKCEHNDLIRPDGDTATTNGES